MNDVFVVMEFDDDEGGASVVAVYVSEARARLIRDKLRVDAVSRNSIRENAGRGELLYYVEGPFEVRS